MSINLGNCGYDLTKEGLRLLRERIYMDSQMDAISGKSDFKGPY